jgi:zinc transport system substrate-binding protein
MTKLMTTFAAGVISMATAAHADTPKVVTDVAPTYAIVAQVMDGVGLPSLIVEQASSPHDFALRPSHARALQEADIVFSVSEGLAPWLVGPMETLATEAAFVFLDEVDGSLVLDVRNDDDHEGGHEDGHDDEDEEHEDHQAHEEEEGHDDHAEEEGHGGHHHTGRDPHSWLDPDNAGLWAMEIADRLSAIDPENATRYQANARAFAKEVASFVIDAEAQFDGLRDKPYFVYHDAYQYFEHRFDIHPIAVVSDTEATAPGPRHIAHIRDIAEQSGATCIAADLSFKAGLLNAISPSGRISAVVLDPLGGLLPLDKDLYLGSLRDLASGLADCLQAKS